MIPFPRKVVLASRSPRRRELLETIGIEVSTRAPVCDETPRPQEAPAITVLRLARLKARSVATEECEVVIAADTLVVRDQTPIGKPRDDSHAAEILESLAGRAHDVVTGFWVRRAREERGGVVRSQVTFRPLEEFEIRAYVASGEGRDKAGAYGIQGLGGALVETVSGSFTNVVGLPLREVLAIVKELTIEWEDGQQEERISVYVPTNHFYLGDYLLFRRSQVHETPMTIQEGIQVCLSAGAAAPKVLRPGKSRV